MTLYSAHKLKPLLYEGPPAWVWSIGISRILVLAVTIVGALSLSPIKDLIYILLVLYTFGLITSVLYVAALYSGRRVPPLMTWTQMLVDFALVAATLGFTGGAYSFFTFLMVIVILEAGLLLGLLQGFIFATMAMIFIAVQSLLPTIHPRMPIEWIELGYRFLIQSMAFYLTAFVSGYWNQRINRMEQFHRRILDNMNGGFIMTDANGVVTFLNQAAYVVLDLPEGAGAGQPVQDILRPASGGECPVLTVLRCKRDYINYEFHMFTKTGENRVLELTTSRLETAGHAPGGVIVSFNDETEMALMRQELQRQDRLAAVGELAAGVAHEIRNPVAAIRGAMDELESAVQNPDLLRKLAAIAVRESDHLNQIVTNFLEFARNPNLRRDLFDLRDLATEVRDLLANEYVSGNGVRLIVTMPDAPCPVLGDRAQLKLACLNLGENAFQAMNGKGTLALTIAPVSTSYEIRFDDEGPGVPPEKIGRIFEPFYTDKERAVGMGLAVCMRIVTAHDGTIRVAPRPGGGASFVVRIPAAPDKRSN